MESKGKETKSLTVSDLLGIIEKQQAQINELNAKMESYRPLGAKVPVNDGGRIKRSDHPDPGGAYIVRMPREWNGTRMGILFRNGIGIIDESLENCDELAHWMHADYGYDVLPAKESEVNRMRKMLEGVNVAKEDKSVAEKLLDVGHM